VQTELATIIESLDGCAGSFPGLVDAPMLVAGDDYQP
jgi:hypothetical protein